MMLDVADRIVELRDGQFVAGQETRAPRPASAYARPVSG
jgi:hypothetical protein